MPAVHLLHYETRHIRKGRKQADANVALPGKPFQNRRKPKCDPVASRSRAEVAARQQDDVALHERLPNRVRTNLLLCAFFLIEDATDPVALIVWQPFRLARPVRQVKNRDNAKYDRGNSLQYK